MKKITKKRPSTISFTKLPEWLPIYGDTTYRGNCAREGVEQATFFNRLRAQYPNSWGLIATHIKNEGLKTQNQVAKDKMQGMVSGASDIMIPGNPTFLCELKVRDISKATIYSRQVEYLKTAQDQGAFVCLALGVDSAWQAFEEYLQKYYK